MSTYTDLHNRVKENITVDYHNRITTQPARFLNEDNEYWGTLKGKITGEDITIKGGLISGVVITDSSLETGIKLPGGFDLAEVGKKIEQVSADHIATRELLHSEVIKRHDDDIALSNKINQTNIDLVRELGTLSIELTKVDNYISVQLSNALTSTASYLSATSDAHDSYLSATSDAHDSYLSTMSDNRYNFLSDSIDQTNLNINKEIYDRVIADEKIQHIINSLSACSDNNDKELSDALLSHIDDNIKAFNVADAKMLSTVEHERHYIINNNRTTDSYPWIVKDYAINVFRSDVPDARVKFTNDDNITTEIGSINLDYDPANGSITSPLPFTFTPYLNIGDTAIASALVGDMPYSFDNVNKIRATNKNLYSIECKLPIKENNELSDATLTLKPELPVFHKVYLDGTDQMIGKFTQTQPTGASSELTSGYLFIDTTDPSLVTFNKFKYCYFDNVENTSLKRETERITYLGNNKFKFEKNISSAKYIQLADNSESHEQFGRIYDFKNGISGIISNDVDGITDINVTVTSPIKTIGHLSKNTGFKDIIDENETRQIILSADVVDKTATFDIVIKSELYGYNIIGVDTNGEPAIVGSVTPVVYNKVLSDLPDFDSVIVDVSKLMWITEFKDHSPYTLTKADTNLWTVEYADSVGNVLNLKFNGVELYIKTTTADGKQIIRLKYDVAINEPFIANTENCHTHRHTTNQISLETFAINIEQPEISYDINVESIESTDQFKEYKLDVESNEQEFIKIIIPSRSTNDISREFFITIKLDSAIPKFIRADFIYEDGTPVKFFNNKKSDLFILANNEESNWTTFMFNEIQPNTFLITDLNDNEDHSILKHLKDKIEQEIIDRGIEDGKLQDQITSNDEDISTLSDDVGYISCNYFHKTRDNIVSSDNTFIGNTILSGTVSADNLSVHTVFVDTDIKTLNLSANSISSTNIMLNNISVESLNTISVLNKKVYRHNDPTEPVTYISTLQDVLDLSVINLSNDIAYLSSKHDSLSASLSNDIIDLSASLSADIIDLSTNLSNDIIDLSTNLSNDIIDLSTNLSNDIIDLSTSISNVVVLSVEKLQDQITSNDEDIKTLSDNLGVVSADLSTKIWIKDINNEEYVNGKYSDLSVIKLPLAEYKQKLINDELCSNAIYVVSSDYIEAYGQVLSNLTMTDDTVESEGATQHYVDTTVHNISSFLSNEILSNDRDIDFISADCLSIDTRYTNTFIDKDHTDVNAHVSSDNLIITDPYTHVPGTETHKQYYMTFESGTLVLKPLN